MLSLKRDVPFVHMFNKGYFSLRKPSLSSITQILIIKELVQES